MLLIMLDIALVTPNKYLKRSTLSTSYVRPSTEDSVRTEDPLNSSNNTPFLKQHTSTCFQKPTSGSHIQLRNQDSANRTGTRIRSSQGFIREASPCKNTSENTYPEGILFVCFINDENDQDLRYQQQVPGHLSKKPGNTSLIPRKSKGVFPHQIPRISYVFEN